MALEAYLQGMGGFDRYDSASDCTCMHDAVAAPMAVTSASPPGEGERENYYVCVGVLQTLELEVWMSGKV